MLLVFGVGFELPLLVIMLNLVGVLSAARLLPLAAAAIFLIFVFAAVATPSQDPFSMCMLAIPMALLFEIAVLFSWLHDRRKARREAAASFSELPDDVASPLDLTVDPIDEPDPGRRRPDPDRRRPHGRPPALSHPAEPPRLATAPARSGRRDRTGWSSRACRPDRRGRSTGSGA